MPNFKYLARDNKGKKVEGVLTVDNYDVLDEKLRELGLFLVDAKEVKNVEEMGFYLGKIKRREIILFTNHLAISINSGISIISAMQDYADETDNPKFKKVIEDILRQVNSGTSMSEALAKHPKVFSELYVSVVATGEATGNLDKVLTDLVGFLEWQEDLISQIKQASIYPAFLISMIIGVIVVMMTFTLPKFIPILEKFDVELPFPTKALIAVSRFFQKGWIIMIIFVVLFIIIYKITYKKPNGRFFWDRIKLKIPLFGKLHHKIVLSKFAHYFSILYSSGIGIIESFKIIERVVGNEVIKRAVARSAEEIEQGKSIYDSLVGEEVFPPLILRMIQVGETSGNLDLSLEKASQYYDKEVPAAIKKMFATFEPLLIIFMGVVVLFIALAIFLPIYKLTSAIGASK